MTARRAFALFTFAGRCGRSAFGLAALLGFALKIQVDRIVAGGSAFGVPWSFAFYTRFGGFARSVTHLSDADARFLATMLAVSLPFCWFGLSFVVRRLRDAGLPLWLATLFFVPIANIAFTIVLAIWPPAKPGDLPSKGAIPPRVAALLPSSRLGSAIAAIAITTTLGFATLVLGSQILAEYGWGLFVAAPFTQGALAAVLYGAKSSRSMAECVLVAVVSVVVAGAAMLLFAFEGVVCIAMAMPLALGFAVFGALVGYQIQQRIGGRESIASAIVVLVFAAPTIMGASVTYPSTAPIFEVTSTIDVAAPPSVVWKRVVAFPDLAPPTELPFRLGIAYPEGAKILGRGVGAVRYCRFSTGPFVEPVTRWDEPRLLAFRVARNPEPMQEWTPFAHVHPPHLDGYMQSLHGQFELQALPGGRTRLTGRTWYRHHLWPATYWSWWSNAIIHRIHLRVLDHVAELAEADVAAERAASAR